MDWQHGFSATYCLMTVNPETWADDEELGIIEGTIERDAEADLIESASITLAEPVGEIWIRLYLQARQESDSEKVALFTGLTSSPERKLDGHRITYPVECYSVLKPADDVLLLRGYTAPRGAGAGLVKELLSVIPAPVEAEDASPALSDNIVAEDGETRLSMANKILDAIGWRLRIEGDGSVTICAKAAESSVRFDANENDVIETEVTDTNDWFECPNVLRAYTEEAGTAVARDDDPESDLSTVSRGREIWLEDTDVNLNVDENIAQYAIRRLREEQQHARTLSYNRRFFDGITVGDIITINYPGYELTGDYRIKTQSITLGYGCRTAEEVTQA